MVVDDDDDPKTVPAGNEPAGNQDAPAPTESPEGDEPEGEAETPATDDVLADAADDGQDDDDEGDEGDGQEQKKTRLRRYREQAERLRAENEALRSRGSDSVPSDAAQLQRAFEYAVWQEIGDPPNPADPKYQNDYVALSIDRQAWETDRRQVSRQKRQEFKLMIEQEQARFASRVDDHRDRVVRFKTKVPDYDAVMAKANLPVAPHVERLLLESKKSEQLGYVLAKEASQKTLARLNRMRPEDAAREIGRLEGRLSLPAQTRTQTQARKPITPLKGGGTSPPSQTAQVNAYIKKMYGNNA
jgi:hypothetical protein